MQKKEFDGKYVQRYMPDKLKLAYYIQQAKGPGRTMAAFAEACQTLSAPSFSRIVHGNLTKPLSVDVIQSIVENAAPGADIDYESMMMANGMVRDNGNFRVPDKYEKREHDELSKEKNRSIIIKNIITGDLLTRGYSVQMIPCYFYSISSEVLTEGKHRLSVVGEFAVKVQDEDPLYRVYVQIGKNGYRLRVEDCAEVFLRDIWEADTLKDVKENFVFDDESEYRETIDRMKDIKVNNRMSLLLVNVSQSSVVEEWEFPRRQKGESAES